MAAGDLPQLACQIENAAELAFPGFGREAASDGNDLTIRRVWSGAGTPHYNPIAFIRNALTSASDLLPCSRSAPAETPRAMQCLYSASMA